MYVLCDIFTMSFILFKIQIYLQMNMWVLVVGGYHTWDSDIAITRVSSYRITASAFSYTTADIWISLLVRGGYWLVSKTIVWYQGYPAMAYVMCPKDAGQQVYIPIWRMLCTQTCREPTISCIPTVEQEVHAQIRATYIRPTFNLCICTPLPMCIRLFLFCWFHLQ